MDRGNYTRALWSRPGRGGLGDQGEFEAEQHPGLTQVLKDQSAAVWGRVHSESQSGACRLSGTTSPSRQEMTVARHHGDGGSYSGPRGLGHGSRVE